MNLQFLSDERGKKTAVVIPIKDWEEIQVKLKQERFVKSLEKSVTEVRQMRDGKLAEPEIKELFHD